MWLQAYFPSHESTLCANFSPASSAAVTSASCAATGATCAPPTQLEHEIKPLTDEALRAKTEEFRARLKAGATLDDLLPEAFAVVREAALRTLGMRHFDVQLIGGIALHKGMIAEMRTGEGKTLVATLPAYLNALRGQGRAHRHGERIPRAARRGLDGARSTGSSASPSA